MPMNIHTLHAPELLASSSTACMCVCTHIGVAQALKSHVSTLLLLAAAATANCYYCAQAMDYSIAQHIIRVHQNQDPAVLDPPFTKAQMQRYIRFARRLNPVVGPDGQVLACVLLYYVDAFTTCLDTLYSSSTLSQLVYGMLTALGINMCCASQWLSIEHVSITFC
jgi:hypothetical protein